MAMTPHGFRTAFVTLGLALLGLTVANLWRFGSTATDENLFIAPPSPVSLGASAGEQATPDSRAGGAATSGVRPGDLVMSIDAVPVSSVAGYEAALAQAGTRVRLQVVRGRPQDTLEVDVDAEALGRVPVHDVAGTALVIDVTRGGASDRGGLRVGDFIVHINGQTFGSIFEADAIMRRGTVGNAIEYDVLRGGRPLTLRVTLAAFGLRLSLVVLTLAGLSFMAFGTFLGLARPWVPAARYAGLAFVLVGFAIGSVLLRRPFEAGLWADLRDATLAASALFGVALALHASLYFPRERPSMLARRWALPCVYGFALVGLALLAFTPRPAVLRALVLGTLLLAGIFLVLGRRDLGPEARRLLRPLTLTHAGVGALMAVVVVGAPIVGQEQAPGYAGLLLLAVPLVHLWVIGRHRLFDLNLRIRRHVQYSLVSRAWTLLPLGLLLAILLALPRLTLPIPNIRVAGSSVEVLGTPVEERERAAAEKVVLMVVAIGLAFGLHRVAQRGQQWLAGKFYRAEHDYRRAAKELSKLVTARPDLEGLSNGLLSAVVSLVQVKRVGAIFYHQGQAFCSPRAHGFTEHEWQRVCGATDDVLEGVRKATAEVDHEYLFPRLRRLLHAVDARYLFPLRAHEDLVGALLLGEKLAEDEFRDEDFEFLGALASQVAPAIENAFLYSELARQERLKHELEIARRIQMGSLPQFTPHIEGLDIAGVSIPAFEVGGDYFDYLNGEPPRFTVMVGDVSGKGTSAALYMSKLQGIVRSLHGFDLTPHELFVRTNDLLSRDLERRSFVTAIGGFFNTTAREMVLARAGHLPLYYYSVASGQVHRVLPKGLGFGLSTRQVFDVELEEQVVRYSAGDVFLFITDGITECPGVSGDDFGEERVAELLSRHAHESARDIRDVLTSAARAFAADAEQFDDQTVVVVKATS